MLEKKHPEKIKLAAPLEKVTTEILAANGRAIEPFIKVFNYSGENITASSLGTLVGIFEVAERSEDSAYIVNFLASVAKKEYFNNPRRGAIESFEAALHKINLALAELVKHGNIAWLGKFHGVLCILEKNNLHFSVTGDAKILLLRSDMFSEISEGLASPESAIHPIKTFVEVSSGRMLLHDKVVLSSPELFTLLSISDLEKHALRMDNERFAQFLRTALINEVDMAGAIIVDTYKSKPVSLPPKKQEEHPPETIHNVFSQQAFTPENTGESIAANSPAKEEASSDYIDSKTGHIYVQGDKPEEASSHPGLEQARLVFQNMGQGMSTLLTSHKRFLRKGKKQSILLLILLAERSAATSRRAARFLRRQSRKGISSLREQIIKIRIAQKRAGEEKKAASETLQRGQEQTTPLPSSPSQSILLKKEVFSAPTPVTFSAPHVTSRPKEESDIPAIISEKLATFYQKNRTSVSNARTEKNTLDKIENAVATVQNLFEKLLANIRPTGEKIKITLQKFLHPGMIIWKNFSPKRQKIILGLSALVLIALIALIFFVTSRSEEKASALPVTVPAIETEAFPRVSEKNARLLDAPIILLSNTDPIIASLFLDNESYLITTKEIINIREQKKYPLPTGSGQASLSALMSDLRLIFIYTDTNELLAWSPISHTFTKNTLVLPEGARVQDIGSYLTYLYVLDDTTDQIYRFPRAEGGFGPSTLWLKDTVAFEENAKIAVNETIFLAPNRNTLQAFFRGRFVKDLESPQAPLAITQLFTSPGLANIYALDSENKRVLVWNQDGSLTAQYFSEALSEARTLTVDEKTGETLVATSDTLLSFKMKLEQ